MKIFIKFIIFVLVLGLAGPFIMRGPDGKPLMDYRKFVPNLSSVKTSIGRLWSDIGAKVSSDHNSFDSGSDSESANGVETWGKTRVFQWQDDDGVWQYTDKPPVGISSETIWLNPNENIVLSMGDPVSEIADEEDSDAQAPGFELPLPLTVSPAEVPKLIEDAKNVKELMEARNEMLESISGESK